MSKWSTTGITTQWSPPNPSLILLNTQQKWTTDYMTRRGRILSEIGTSLNVFQKPSFSVVDSAFEITVLNGSSGNTGNFLAALQMVANYDDICMGQERLLVPCTNAHPLSS